MEGEFEEGWRVGSRGGGWAGGGEGRKMEPERDGEKGKEGILLSREEGEGSQGGGGLRR